MMRASFRASCLPVVVGAGVWGVVDPSSPRATARLGLTPGRTRGQIDRPTGRPATVADEPRGPLGGGARARAVPLTPASITHNAGGA